MKPSQRNTGVPVGARVPARGGKCRFNSAICAAKHSCACAPITLLAGLILPPICRAEAPLFVFTDEQEDFSFTVGRDVGKRTEERANQLKRQNKHVGETNEASG